MSHRYEYRDDFPSRRRHHSPSYSEYGGDTPYPNSSRDAGAVRLARRHHDHSDRRAHFEDYQSDRHRPYDDEYYYYDEKRSHSRPRSRNHDHEHANEHHHGRRRSRSKRRHSNAGPNWSQAAIAAASAGIIEAGLSRNDRDRTSRIVTAAAGAGAIDAVAARHHEKPHKSWEHIVGSTVGGLVIDRVAHGSGRR
ncbi:uncharacterized protein CTRU02_206637 [Colletotrichum truncatum]|uniref:Uncharacterized protein n=1 Tax=Colletotrichum truncatum TaxID=5467 RepID=A0ACC3Z7D5_COLTU|nr:uncharacterized protein CTRU02_13759 [Colletotrichum truncatum]KAF6782933.1 hypothetical protein CTRU02_13759 [Colletotrichum truncatum]